MTELRIGVVAEGPTDQIVLRHLLTAYCKGVHPDITPVFKDLHPNRDGTSSSSPEGGWTTVYGWCLDNKPAERKIRYLTRDLFAGGLDEKQCDLILVHMDSDISEEVGDKSTAIPVPDATSTPEQRGDFIRKTLLEWLWPEGSIPDGRHIAAPAVEAVETWLVAALSEDERPEASKNILRRLIEVDYASRGRVAPEKAKGIRKKPDRYETLSAHCAGKVTQIADRCPHFRFIAESLFPEV